MAAVQSLTSSVNGVATLRWRHAANASTYRQELVLGMLWMTPPQHSGGSSFGGSKFDSGAREPSRLPACLLLCQFTLWRCAKYCDEYVCLSACVTRKPHGQTPPIFLCTLPMAQSRSSSGGIVMLCISGFVDDNVFIP